MADPLFSPMASSRLWLTYRRHLRTSWVYGASDGADGGLRRLDGRCHGSNPWLTACRASAMTSFTDFPSVDIGGCTRSFRFCGCNSRGSVQDRTTREKDPTRHLTDQHIRDILAISFQGCNNIAVTAAQRNRPLLRVSPWLRVPGHEVASPHTRR